MSWKVVGHHKVLDVEPGGIIDFEIPAEQAQNLVAGGHIALVEDAEHEQEETSTEVPTKEAPAEVAESTEGS